MPPIKKPAPPAPPRSWRQHLLAFSALLAFLSLFSDVRSSLDIPENNQPLKLAVARAKIKGLRPAVVVLYAATAKDGLPITDELYADFLDYLDVATKSAHGAGILVPSDQLLLDLALALQDDLSSESASQLLSTYSSSVRQQRFALYRKERLLGLPPASAATRAALVH